MKNKINHRSIKRKTTINRSSFPWDKLLPEWKEMRIISQQAAEVMDNKDVSLTKACLKMGIRLRDAIKNLKKAFYKRKGRWHHHSNDKIQFQLEMYSEGERILVVTTNSKDRSLIGEYYSAVNQFLTYGRKEGIEKLKGKFIIDDKGKKHYFETNYHKIKEIDERIEDPELQVVYHTE
jgi:hypothetical protein